MRGQKRLEDTRERAYAPRIHLLREKVLQRRMDCLATRACPSCAFLCAASPAMTGFLPGANGCCTGHVRSAAETPYIMTQHWIAGTGWSFLQERGGHGASARRHLRRGWRGLLSFERRRRGGHARAAQGA